MDADSVHELPAGAALDAREPTVAERRTNGEQEPDGESDDPEERAAQQVPTACTTSALTFHTPPLSCTTAVVA